MLALSAHRCRWADQLVGPARARARARHTAGGWLAMGSEAALAAAADFIGSDACRRVVVLTGAGVSVAAGIPDFRSPGGMYETLRPE